MKELANKLRDILLSGKGLLIVALLILLVMVFYKGKSGVEGTGNTVDNSNKVTVSNDTLNGNAVKIGDIENTQGDIIIKK